MQSVVVDSSVVVKWINSQNESNLQQADKLLKANQRGESKLYVPELTKYEVGNVLWKKGLDRTTAKASLATLYSLPLYFITQDEIQAQETLEIALRNGITFYDASFIALAKYLNAPLITDNPKHQKKYTGITVIPLQNYR